MFVLCVCGWLTGFGCYWVTQSSLPDSASDPNTVSWSHSLEAYEGTGGKQGLGPGRLQEDQAED